MPTGRVQDREVDPSASITVWANPWPCSRRGERPTLGTNERSRSISHGALASTPAWRWRPRIQRYHSSLSSSEVCFPTLPPPALILLVSQLSFLLMRGTFPFAEQTEIEIARHRLIAALSSPSSYVSCSALAKAPLLAISRPLLGME
jgi:hypothetical protein